MASSQEILASPHEAPAGPGQRERWADSLRVLVIAVVVVFHTATAYLGGSDWYYMDPEALVDATGSSAAALNREVRPELRSRYHEREH